MHGRFVARGIRRNEDSTTAHFEGLFGGLKAASRFAPRYKSDGDEPLILRAELRNRTVVRTSTAVKKIEIVAKELRWCKCAEDELLLESQEVERAATLRRIKRAERVPTFCRHKVGLECTSCSGIPAASFGLSDCLVCKLPGRA